jgi:outer membrane protein OmpA-like peptidoglycan-associated protein
MRHLLTMTAVACVLTATWTGLANACQPLADVTAAYNKNDEAGAHAIVASGDFSQCSPAEKKTASNIAGLVTFNRIAQVVGPDDPLGNYRAELEGLQQNVGAPWQVIDALADLARTDKDYVKAARLYESALLAGADEATTPDWMAPDASYIERLDRLATEMKLAAPITVASRAACKGNFRGVALTKKTVPIRFDFGKDTFTVEGKKAADDLFKCLSQSKAANIAVIGHTDPVGSDQANLALSIKRASAVERFLKEQGFGGYIEVIGKGEADPFKPDDPKAYDEETLHQLDRRVEVDVR